MVPAGANNRFLERMRRGGVLFDGAMGSMLISSGLEPGAPPEEWNRSHPNVVQSIHVDYLLAGAEVATTNSFGATPGRLEAYGLGGELAALNNASVRLARDAISQAGNAEARFVAFSVGPTGKMLPPVGQASVEEIEREFAGQLESLESPVDLVIAETFFDVREALVVLEVAKRSVDAPVGVSMTFNKTPRGFFTVMGDAVAKSIGRLASAGADFVAANCSIASGDMVELAQVLRSATDLPVLCQPNAGAPTVRDGTPLYEQPPEEFAADAGRMFGIGVEAVGGCCGTNPEFIRHAAKSLVK